MASGIYRWTVNRGEKPPLVYVGQAQNLERRRGEYVVAWRKNEPDENERLYYAVRKYGAGAVSYDVVELVEPGRLTEREHAWYAHYKDLEYACLCKVANFIAPGTPPPRDPQVQMKMREAARERFGANWRDDDFNALTTPPQSRKLDLRSRERMFMSPSGELVVVVNLHSFCVANELPYPKMHEVHSGRRRQYRGWTRYEGE